MALTLFVEQQRFLVSSIGLVLALLVAQTRIESGIHSGLEVLYGAALGAMTTLVLFQAFG
jgi:diacylglycerol kinase (ATP)